MRINLSKNEFLFIKSLLIAEKEKEISNSEIIDVDKFSSSIVDYLLDNKFKEFIFR